MRGRPADGGEPEESGSPPRSRRRDRGMAGRLSPARSRSRSGDGVDVAEVRLALGLGEVVLGDLGRPRDDPAGRHGDGRHGIRAARLEIGVDQVGLGLRLGLLV